MQVLLIRRGRSAGLGNCTAAQVLTNVNDVFLVIVVVQCFCHSEWTSKGLAFNFSDIPARVLSLSVCSWKGMSGSI